MSNWVDICLYMSYSVEKACSKAIKCKAAMLVLHIQQLLLELVYVSSKVLSLRANCQKLLRKFTFSLCINFWLCMTYLKIDTNSNTSPEHTRVHLTCTHTHNFTETFQQG